MKLFLEIYKRYVCAKYDWNWLPDSREEDFLIPFMNVQYLVIIYPSGEEDILKIL